MEREENEVLTGMACDSTGKRPDRSDKSFNRQERLPGDSLVIERATEDLKFL
jgi:hypothetical protein